MDEILKLLVKIVGKRKRGPLVWIIVFVVLVNLMALTIKALGEAYHEWVRTPMAQEKGPDRRVSQDR